MSSFKNQTWGESTARFSSRRIQRAIVSICLFSGLLLILAVILLFLSKHEPDPTPDQVGAVLSSPGLSA